VRTTNQTSRSYALAQTVLLCVFAGAFFLTAGPALFVSTASKVAGAVLCVIGLLLMFSALASIRGAVQIAPEPRADAQLVTSGIYRRLRHPIYSAILLLVVGLFLRKPTVAVGVAAAVIIAFLLMKVRVEEKLLLARYPQYADYKRHSWGLMPWLR
jgi:protein-S-isoprenylcysteine O-methyltransferase Ste14